MLYSRDYLQGLTDEEKEQYKAVTGRELSGSFRRFGKVISPSKYPKAVRMCKTLFPNNYLDFVELRDTDRLKDLNEKFLNFINEESTNEREVLNYIKATESYHIIGSILYGCHINIGHHGTFLFPEFQLGSKFGVDYLLCGKSSGGYEFVLVELENVRGKITQKDGDLGFEFRDGISQLKDWKRWLQSTYSAFTDTIKKYKNSEMNLPEEFYTLDMSRFHYVVIAGRRNDFNELTYRIRRESKKDDDIIILHYDNLYDYANKLIGKVTY